MTDLEKRVSEIDPGGMSLYHPAVSMNPAVIVSLGSMEGIPEHTADRQQPISERSSAAKGIVLVLLVTAAAYLLRHTPLWPITIDGKPQLSASLLAILIGLIIRNLFSPPAELSKGIKLVVKRLIPIAIVCIGAGLHFGQLRGAGPTALGVMVGCVVVAYLAAYSVSRLLGLSKKTSILLGTGTGICGSSAIVAAAPLIDADDEDVVLSVGTVNLLGLIAMLSLPALATSMGMDARAFGVWCGATIHAVPQVLAAADAHPSGPTTAVQWATLIKLARVVLLAPLVVILAVVYSRRRTASDNGPRIHPARLVPWYIWGFLGLALVNTLGWLPSITSTISLADQTYQPNLVVSDLFSQLGKVLLIIALAGIGLEVRLKKLASVGGRAIIAGFASTLVLGAVAYALIAFLLS